MSKLTIYFDFGSPYSYLAWRRVQAHPERYADVQVEWVAVSAGHLFAQDGNQPNASFPNLSAYTLEDVRRWAQAYRVPIVMPESFPCRTIEASRLHFAAQAQGHDVAKRWMEAAFEAHWVQGRDLSDASVLGALADEVGIRDPLAAVTDPENKRRLVEATGAAYAAGAPGVPFMVIHHPERDVTEGFWGNDRLAWVEAVILGGPLPSQL